MNADKSIDWLIDAYRNLAKPDHVHCNALIEKLKDPERLLKAIEESGIEFHDPLNPKEFGDFVILGPVGSGGMGEVFRVQHKKLNRIQALKLLPPHRVDNQQASRRFEREMLAIGKLKHVNIVTVYDAGVVDGTPFLAMELIDGQSLAQLVRNHKKNETMIPIMQAIDIVAQAAKGVEHAHQNKVLHRDIKPANLMIDHDGTVKLLDLGLAKIKPDNRNPAIKTQSLESRQLTANQEILGTPDFMAPEQISGQVDERTDIYALGATLYFLLTGQVLFPTANSSLIHKALAITNESPPLSTKFRPTVPDSLNQAIAKSLSKDPSKRQQTVAEFLDEIQVRTNRFVETISENLEAVTENPKIASTESKSCQNEKSAFKPGQGSAPVARRAQTNSSIFNFATDYFSPIILIGLAVLLAGSIGYLVLRNNFLGSIVNPNQVVKFPFEVEYFSKKFPELASDDPAQIHLRNGLIGKDVFSTKFADFTKVNLIFHQPRYFYLLALNPTDDPKFKIQLCLPNDETQIPVATKTSSFPLDDLSLYQLTDGIGQLAFVLLVSDEPLPPFQTWKSDHLKSFPWQISRTPDVWRYDKASGLDRLLPKHIDRGHVKSVTNTVVKSCTEFLNEAPIEQVFWLSFPVADIAKSN